jgi:hypothetical protein
MRLDLFLQLLAGGMGVILVDLEADQFLQLGIEGHAQQAEKLWRGDQGQFLELAFALGLDQESGNVF